MIAEEMVAKGMIAKYLSALWSAAAPGIANHLWQSTLIALVAFLFTLALREHYARARYWLWLAASVKFLVPFSLLVALGSNLAWHRPTQESATPALYLVAQEVGQPFAPPAMHEAANATMGLVSRNFPHFLPWLLAAWSCGFVFIVATWLMRWRRISAAMKGSIPLSEGREVGILRRMERIGGIRRPISLVLSQASMEPGIFGITHPVLLWPEGISKHLQDEQLEAVLAHEVWHVRRRDNLCAVLHMLVEAIFWFYPLVWWLGARLVEERERACDEEVVAVGNDRQVYAESILKVCEFCLAAPLPCVSGVTGADLKKRMVHIMNDRILHNLGFARKLLLTIAGTLAIAIPVTFGIFHATPSQAQSQLSPNVAGPTFASASVRPHRATTEPNRSKMGMDMHDGTFFAQGVTLGTLIQLAYHAQGAQLMGGPDWVNTAKFDVEAKLDTSLISKHEAEAAEMHKQHMSDHANGSDPASAMFKALLTDQFKLALHPETRNLPAYELVVDSNGSKLQESTDVHFMKVDRGALNSQGIPIILLAQQLSLRLGRPVVDRTGLKGHYAFDLHWTPDPSEDERLRTSEWQGGDSSAAVPSGPPLLEAVQEQLGLKLVPVTEPVQVLVIDHAELPSE